MVRGLVRDVQGRERFIDPTGPVTGELRVLRGEAFVDFPRIVRAAIRNYNQRGYRVHNHGFRLARTYDFGPSRIKRPSRK